MKRLFSKLSLLLPIFTVIIYFSSCKEQNESFSPNKKDTTSLSKRYELLLKSYGFNAINDKGQYYLIDTDIRIYKKDLDKRLSSNITKKNDAVISLRYKEFLVTQDDIYIKIDSSMPTSGDDNWWSEIEDAIDELNSIPNFRLNFILTTSSTADITIQSDNGEIDNSYLANASFPTSDNKPGNNIFINLDWMNNRIATSKEKRLQIIHEISHCIGLLHINHNDPLVLGTEIEASRTYFYTKDQKSVMWSYMNSQSDGLSRFDKLALRTIYSTDSGIKPFLRYWHNNWQRHFYTSDFFEIGWNGLTDEYQTSYNGYRYENFDGYIFTYQASGTVPLYRHFRQNTEDHYYTLTPGPIAQYTYEKIAGYVYSTQVSGSIPLYGYWNSSVGNHFLTADFNELGYGKIGYVYEGIKCYMLPD